MQSRVDAATVTKSLTPIPLSPSLDVDSHQQELVHLCEDVNRYGYAIYEWDKASQDIPQHIKALHRALSLQNTDDGVLRATNGLSLLEDLSGTPQGRFPPYQSAPLNWHTDGYYNAENQAVRCFTLHCVEPAAQGGELVLMDDTLLVWALLQENPEMVQLLTHPQAMTLPANADKEGHDRPDRTTAMIKCDSDARITMRFTTRARNIRWRCSATQAAAARAAELITHHQHWHSQVALKRGQGVITRNILHARNAFNDTLGSPKRQILRGRFNQLPVYHNLQHVADKTHALR